MPIKLVALLSARPGREAELEAAIRTIVARVRAAEPGALRYDLWREPDGARRFLIDELYVDEAAVAAHRVAPHYLAFRETVADLLAALPEVVTVHDEDAAE